MCPQDGRGGKGILSSGHRSELLLKAKALDKQPVVFLFKFLSLGDHSSTVFYPLGKGCLDCTGLLRIKQRMALESPRIIARIPVSFMNLN